MPWQKGESVMNEHRHMFIPQHDLKHLNLSRLLLSLLIHLVFLSFISNFSTLCSFLFFSPFLCSPSPHLSALLSSPVSLSSALCLILLLSSQCLCLSSLVSPVSLHLHPSLLSSERGSFHCRLICQGEKWECTTLRDTKQAFDSNGIMRWRLNIKITEGKNAKCQMDMWREGYKHFIRAGSLVCTAQWLVLGLAVLCESLPHTHRHRVLFCLDFDAGCHQYCASIPGQSLSSHHTQALCQGCLASLLIVLDTRSVSVIFQHAW